MAYSQPSPLCTASRKNLFFGSPRGFFFSFLPFYLPLTNFGGTIPTGSPCSNMSAPLTTALFSFHTVSVSWGKGLGTSLFSLRQTFDNASAPGTPASFFFSGGFFFFPASWMAQCEDWAYDVLLLREEGARIDQPPFFVSPLPPRVSFFSGTGASLYGKISLKFPNFSALPRRIFPLAEGVPLFGRTCPPLMCFRERGFPL